MNAINPSSLFPELKRMVRTWKRVNVGVESFYSYAHCLCEDNDETAIPGMVTVVGMKLHKIQCGASTILFKIGECDKCKTVYWNCEDFIWVTYLTERDLLETALVAMSTKYTTCNDRTIQVGDQRGLKMPTLNFDFDNQGRCEYQRIEFPT